MSIVTKSPKVATKQPSADELLNQALEWLKQRQEDTYGPSASGADLAFVSIAASLREIAGKLK